MGSMLTWYYRASLLVMLRDRIYWKLASFFIRKRVYVRMEKRME